MRHVQCHHCRTAFHPSTPQRRRRLRDSTQCQRQLDARRRLFVLMETHAAFGPDIVPSLHLKRQAQQRGANHRNTHAPNRPRRRPRHCATRRQRPGFATPSGPRKQEHAAAANPAQVPPAVVKHFAERAPSSAEHAAPSSRGRTAAAHRPCRAPYTFGHNCRTALQAYAPKRRRWLPDYARLR